MDTILSRRYLMKDRLTPKSKYTPPDRLPCHEGALCTLVPVKRDTETSKFVNFIRRVSEWGPKRNPQYRSVFSPLCGTQSAQKHQPNS